MIFRRKINSMNMEDPNAIDNIEYNPYSGAKKGLPVGPALEYIGVATSEIKVLPGEQLFFFKTTTGLGWVTMSETTGVAAGSAPAANTFPIQGQVFTPYSSSSYKYIITTADVHLYKLKDDTEFRNNP
jgi:hypothetical protein